MIIGSSEWESCLETGAHTLHLHPGNEAVKQFAVHAQQMLAWNRKINLTAITDPKEVAVKHFLDSIAVLPFIPEHARLLDMGSGAGFPGIPLKIMRPDLQVTLIDASRKKVSFQNHVIRTLKLTGIYGIHGRAEDLAADPALSEAFDVVICRAFSDLRLFFKLARPFLNDRGQMVALKGKIEDQEILSVKSSRTRMQIKHFSLPYLDAQRSIVVHSLSNSCNE